MSSLNQLTFLILLTLKLIIYLFLCLRLRPSSLYTIGQICLQDLIFLDSSHVQPRPWTLSWLPCRSLCLLRRCGAKNLLSLVACHIPGGMACSSGFLFMAEQSLLSSGCCCPHSEPCCCQPEQGKTSKNPQRMLTVMGSTQCLKR